MASGEDDVDVDRHAEQVLDQQEQAGGEVDGEPTARRACVAWLPRDRAGAPGADHRAALVSTLASTGWPSRSRSAGSKSGKPNW